MATKLSDSEQVTAHINALPNDIAQIIEYVRQTILGTHADIGERIKWNNPSFYYTGEMQAFDPKEYKREIIVMNLHKSRIMLVWPSGAKLTNINGILEGNYADGRRLITFGNLEDVKSKENILKSLLIEWLSLVEK